MKGSLPIVLLVCKDPSKVAFFKSTLKNSYTIIHAENHEEGLEWLRSSPIEILILDGETLNSSLETVCGLAQKASKAKYLPILFLSNTLKKSFILNALHAGVSDFLHEPLEALEIHERIAVCLKSKMISKKMSLVSNKIKSSSFLPKNTQAFAERMLIREKTLQVITSAKKGSVPLSVLMIHLDSLSKLKQTLKENALQEITDQLEFFLKGRLRTYDTLVIESPGQYLILLPKTSQSAAQVIAGDIQKEISRTTLVTSVKEVLVTVSIGVVSFGKELSKSAKAFEQFDRCLERVKKSLIQTRKKEATIVAPPK